MAPMGFLQIQNEGEDTAGKNRKKNGKNDKKLKEQASKELSIEYLNRKQSRDTSIIKLKC